MRLAKKSKILIYLMLEPRKETIWLFEVQQFEAANLSNQTDLDKNKEHGT